MVPSAPFVVEYIYVGRRLGAMRRREVVFCNAKMCLSAERVCVEDERVKLHKHSLKPPAERICRWVSEALSRGKASLRRLRWNAEGCDTVVIGANSPGKARRLFFDGGDNKGDVVGPMMSLIRLCE